MASATPLKVSIRFESDWHVGEGAGQPKFIDRLVRRDPHDRLPYVPAKSWGGIWRDGCERIARGLDEGKGRAWRDLVDRIFGDQPGSDPRSTSKSSPGPARLTLSPARLATPIRHLLRRSGSNSALNASLTYIKPGVKIDRQTGTAENKHLHMDEVVRGDVVLTAEVDIATEGLSRDASDAVLALLWAGSRAAERLGGKRRRGLGRCTIAIEGFEAEAQRFLKVLGGDPPNVARRSPNPSNLPALHSPGNGPLVSLRLRVTLRQPVIVPDRTIGNVVYSRDHIPGSYLLGPVSAALQRILSARLDSWIARGDLRASHAYPTVEGVRGRPIPFALFHEKDKAKGDIWNRLVESENPDKQLKQVRSGYVGSFSGASLPAFVDSGATITQATHNTIDDWVQRPTSDVGGVYTYQAIGAGTELEARILMRQSLVNDLRTRDKSWNQRVSGNVRLGISKKDDYGLVHLQFDVPDEPKSAANPTSNSSSPLTLWLLSDVLLRGASGRSEPTIPALLDALNAQLAPATVHLAQTGPGEAVFARSSRNDGWLVRWGLPRPSYAGIAAGSCLRLDVTGTIPMNTLDQLQREGIGERRAEGYGEISFDDPLVVATLSGKPRAPDTPPEEPPLPTGLGEPVHQRLAERLQQDAWSREIDRVAPFLWTGDRQARLGWQTRKPGNSQLGSLRAALLQLQDRTSPGRKSGFRPLQKWLEEVRNGSRQDRWPGNSLEQIGELAKTPKVVWDWIRGAVIRNDTGVPGTDEDKKLLDAVFPLLPGQERTAVEASFHIMAVRRVLLAAIRAETRQRETTNENSKEAEDGAQAE